MPRVKLTDNLKDAISQLPKKKKDQLLFRLIPKDALLVDKLTFQLIENSATTDERRDKVEDKIFQSLSTLKFRYAIKLAAVMRRLSGDISRHVRATSDKYGEVYLNLFLLNTAFSIHQKTLAKVTSYKAHSFYLYVVKKGIKINKLLKAMHEDIHIDFQDDLMQLGAHLLSYPPIVRLAETEGLDLNKMEEGVIV